MISTQSLLGKTHPQKKDVAMTAVATKKWQTEIIDLPFQIKEIDFLVVSQCVLNP
jgi:hypothetical protein